MTRYYGSPSSLHILTSRSILTVLGLLALVLQRHCETLWGCELRGRGQSVCDGFCGYACSSALRSPVEARGQLRWPGLTTHLDTGITSMHQYSQLCSNVTVLFILWEFHTCTQSVSTSSQPSRTTSVLIKSLSPMAAIHTHTQRYWSYNPALSPFNNVTNCIFIWFMLRNKFIMISRHLSSRFF